MLENSKLKVITETTGATEVDKIGTGKKSLKELFEEAYQKKGYRKTDDYDNEDNHHDDDDADCFCD